MEYKRWTQSAIECYERKCICKGCPTKELFETKCRMKECVAALLDKFGEPPNFMTDDIFPDMSDKQREIIEAILEGATTSEQIAEKLNTTRSNAITYLNQLYKKAEITSCTFFKKSGRLPEFIEFINNFVKKKEQEKKMSNFIDEDLKIEYPPYLEPYVRVIKEGAETLSVIAYRAQKKRGTASVALDDLHKHLVKQNLILPNDKSKREQIIDFIQSRLLDTNYTQLSDVPEEKEEPVSLDKLTETESKVLNLLLDGHSYKDAASKLFISDTTLKTHVNNIFTKKHYHSLQELIIGEFKNRMKILKEKLEISANSDSRTLEIIEENKQLKQRISELEQQPPQTFNILTLRIKIQKEIEHLQQKLNKLDVFEQEFMRSENAK